MRAVETLDIASWTGPFGPALCDRALAELEEATRKLASLAVHLKASRK